MTEHRLVLPPNPNIPGDDQRFITSVTSVSGPAAIPVPDIQQDDPSPSALRRLFDQITRWYINPLRPVETPEPENREDTATDMVRTWNENRTRFQTLTDNNLPRTGEWTVATARDGRLFFNHGTI